jgi:AraC-like DNA-binding protein
MERIFKNNRLSFFEDALWADASVKRSEIMTPLYLERYCGVCHDTTLTCHEHWEYSAHISGTGILYSETNQQIRPDIIFLIPPGVSHAESSRHELDTVWLGFYGELPGVKRDKIISLKSHEMIKRIIDYWSFSSRSHGLTGPELDGILLTLTGYFFRKLQRDDQKNPMQRAVEYFNSHYQELVSIQDMAEKFGYSAGHFYRQFKELSGETPINFLNNIRLKKAVFYLQYSELPIHKIAALCGFSDPYYFSRIFSRKKHISPLQYRKKHKQ